MVKLDKVEFDRTIQEQLPLAYRKIYYNEIANIEEEKKLLFYSNSEQSESLTFFSSDMDISKTLDKHLLLLLQNGEKGTKFHSIC